MERILIPKLIEEYPTHTYLRHLGSKSVNLVRARQAKNYEIIFTDIILDTVFMRAFFETYDFCREYFMSIIYNKAFRARYELYENYIGMNIMIMTIQRLIVDSLKMGIERDFYDLVSVQKLFNVYGLPFYDDLPLDYQRMIVKNLNRLLRCKSTDKVLYDVTTTLFYERVHINKFYLVKDRKLDENGNAIFAYKYVDDEIVGYDYEEMYKCYFQSTDLMERNVISTLETKYNRYHYEDVVNDDVYWWETEELKKELYEREYNFIDTKYIGINIMQNVTKMLYESCYYLNLLIDHKETTTELEMRMLNSDAMKQGTDYLFLDLDRISPIPVSIFDSVILLCALISKKNGMKGNIIVKSPAQILSVLGFNFEANFDLIRENILKYKRVFKNPEILKYLDLLDIRSVEDIDILYNNFKNFTEFCEDMIANTIDINEYKAYKELYNVIRVRKDMTELFTKHNGEVATTYLEYLYDKVPNIAAFVEEIHKDKTGIYIEHIIGKLNELVPKIEYLTSLNGTNNNIVNALVGMINFFKSYTVDLRNLNMVFIYDNKALNKIFMIDDPRLFNRLYPEEKALKYNDTLTYKTFFDKYHNLVIYDQSRLSTKIVPKQYVQYDENYFISNKLEYEDSMQLEYKDTIEVISHQKCKDFMKLKVDDHYSIDILNKVYVGAFDKINQLKMLFNVEDDLELEYKDHMHFIKLINEMDEIELKHMEQINVFYYNNEFGTMIDKIKQIRIMLSVNDNFELQYKDIISVLKHVFNIKTNFNMIFDYILLPMFYNNEKINLRHIYSYISNLHKEDNLELDYKDFIKIISEQIKHDDVNLEQRYLLNGTYNQNEEIIRDEYNYIINFDKEEQLELNYKDELNIVSVDSSNNNENFIMRDSIMIFYEN
jgi:hypothetical protein